MVNNVICSRFTMVCIALLILVFPTGAWSIHLPINKNLTVVLSTLSAQGQLKAFSEITSKTDPLGKIAFTFPTVPSSAVTPFLHIQIMDGDAILRQAIVPSPQPGGKVDVGVSEVTDLQARSLFKASIIAGKLTPLHLLVAHALLRTPAISIADAEAVGAAIAAGANAIEHVLATDDISPSQLSAVMHTLSNGLVDVAAIYRMSVDDALLFDQNVEAYRVSEAFSVLLQSFVKASSDNGINLETIYAAFVSAGAAAESLIEPSPIINSITKSRIRLGYVIGALSLSRYRSHKEIVNSLKYVSISRPQFSRMFDALDFLYSLTSFNLKYLDRGLIQSYDSGDVNPFWQQEFNALAMQDLSLSKVSLEFYFAFTSNPEYENLMLDITSRMANMGGIMSGMTPSLLMQLLGYDTSLQSVPMLSPLNLAAWSYAGKQSAFMYTPIPGLIDQVANKPITPEFDKLLEPYKSIALLWYDVTLTRYISRQELQRLENEYLSSQDNPQRWIPFETYYRMVEDDRNRLALIQKNISGVSKEAKQALIYLLAPFMNTI